MCDTRDKKIITIICLKPKYKKYMITIFFMMVLLLKLSC